MRNTVRIIGVSLVSMAGFLLISGIAWAQATKESVSGSAPNYYVTDPGKIWLDDEGIRHFRNRRTRVRWEGDIDGWQFRIDDLNVNTLTREADFHGSFTFAGYVREDLVTAKGRSSTQCTGDPSICEEHTNWFLDDGRMIKVTEVYALDSDDTEGYEGTILDPPGR